MLAGCGGGDEEESTTRVNPDGSITSQMVEENGSGQSGTATFHRLEGENTRIVIELDGSDGTFPAYVHENACNRPDPTLTDPLRPVVDGRSETVIEVSFQHLRTSPHSVIVHKSKDALDDYVACGSIGRLGSPEREESLLER